MLRVDVTRELKQFYNIKNAVEEIYSERAIFLTIEGQGPPGGVTYRKAVEMLYTTVFTLKMNLKKQKFINFTISKLECIWRVEHQKPLPTEQKEWRLMLRIPSQITSQDLMAVKEELMVKESMDLWHVRRTSWNEGQALQKIHVGPYPNVADTYNEIRRHAEELGYQLMGLVHEIYLSDASRVNEKRLKTIVRIPIASNRSGYAQS